MADAAVGAVAQAPPGSVQVLTEGKQPGQANRVAEAPQPEPQIEAPQAAETPQEEVNWEAEARKLRRENEKWRNRTHEAETKYENAKKVFPNIDEMTPEQLVSTLENEQAARQKVETELRDLRLDARLRAATQTAGVDHDLTVAFLRQEGRLSDVDISAPDASQVLSDMVADVKASKPQLAVAPGAAPVSGSGTTPGVSEPVSSASQADAALRRGDYDGYLQARREAEGSRAGHGRVNLVTL